MIKDNQISNNNITNTNETLFFDNSSNIFVHTENNNGLKKYQSILNNKK